MIAERPVVCAWRSTLPIVPPADVIPVAERTSATPYDVPGVELSHVGDGCSFDAFVSKYGLDHDPAISTIATIVRGADTGKLFFLGDLSDELRHELLCLAGS